MSRLVSNEITTTLDMVNSTYMGRARALERGLDYALAKVPDAEFVTIRVYKWVEDEPTGTEPGSETSELNQDEGTEHDGC